MDCKRIEILMNKFWECNTTPEEENELRQFFLECRELPPHLSVYRELFVWQAEESRAGLDDAFDRRVLVKIGKRRRLPIFVRKYITTAAACAFLALCIGGLLRHRQVERVPFAEESLTPQQALAELQKALSFVSETMNEGERLMETNIGKAKVATKYIHELKKVEL